MGRYQKNKVEGGVRKRAEMVPEEYSGSGSEEKK